MKRRTNINATVYYTALEGYHTKGTKKAIKGYLGDHGDTPGSEIDIGKFDSGFLNKVDNEGTGRLSSPRIIKSRSFTYLNWSRGVGFWLDVVPCDSYGNALQAFVTSAADGSVLPRGTRFRITDCGRDSTSGDRMDAGACSEWKAAIWEVQDEFTPGLGGVGHIDLYIGEENMPSFEKYSPRWVDQAGVQIARL